ncbi:hypothetical protein CCC_02397 [Paramagnetospirillum magnetotacticum MS-1]|uniref:Lipoprotein n=1 Tax=Paramagnetospirillum magnetotacticum MS-1 TaxID=272627 RepID=A0A0C2UBS9_PARME|nr:hypothetical protein [Paramagnetospirillum magnetotacticum]KIL98947.1 hypothetical protein CCC_02397 [Paramagnetospirillum magnetotacticum MS-1]
MAVSRLWLLVPVLLAFASSAFAQACPPAGAFVPQRIVTFSTWMAEPTYSSEQARARITALSGLTRPDSKDFTTGLTRTSTNLELRVQGWQIDLGQGRRCMGLARVEAVWKITEIKVDIAREYPPGGCQYRVIRTHEDEHVAISRDAFRHWTPQAEIVLRNAAAQIPPRITTSSPDVVTGEFKDRLTAALKPTFEAYANELRLRNAAIDTPGNYRRVNGLCPSW